MFKGEIFMFERYCYRLQKRWVLLVSLLLLVVIAIWVVPSLISYVQQRRLISAAESLYHSMQAAQSYAKRYQKPITLILFSFIEVGTFIVKDSLTLVPGITGEEITPEFPNAPPGTARNT